MRKFGTFFDPSDYWSSGLNLVLPGLRNTPRFVERYLQEWIQRRGQSPLVLHAVFFCVTHYVAVICGTESTDRRLLYHRGKTLKLLREAMSDPQATYEQDDIFMSIIILALNDRFVSQPPLPHDPSPFHSPLDKIQWLNICASQPLSSQHWIVIQFLLRQQGGLANLKRFGLPWIVT